MERLLVVSDIHGRYAALKDVFKKSGYKPLTDRLVILGDVVDRGKKSKEVVEKLAKLKNKIFVIGNHDMYFVDFYKNGVKNKAWLSENGGGYETLISYGYAKTGKKEFKIPASHEKFFDSARPYYEEGNILFVHGGFNLKTDIYSQDIKVLTESRNLITYAMDEDRIGKWDLVFVGHTPVQKYSGQNSKPLKFENLVLADCGAGWNGNLALINAHNPAQYWLSNAKD